MPSTSCRSSRTSHEAPEGHTEGVGPTGPALFTGDLGLPGSTLRGCPQRDHTRYHPSFFSLTRPCTNNGLLSGCQRQRHRAAQRAQQALRRLRPAVRPRSPAQDGVPQPWVGNRHRAGPCCSSFFGRSTSTSPSIRAGHGLARNTSLRRVPDRPALGPHLDQHRRPDRLFVRQHLPCRHGRSARRAGPGRVPRGAGRLGAGPGRDHWRRPQPLAAGRHQGRTGATPSSTRPRRRQAWQRP